MSDPNPSEAAVPRNPSPSPALEPTLAPRDTSATPNGARMGSPRAAVPPGGPVYRIAVTGGPCGGKTTALAEVSERLRSRGVSAFMVPEAATLFFTGGASALDLGDAGQALALQEGILRSQIALEDSFLGLARAAGGRAVVLCDRGALDGSVYMARPGWAALLAGAGYDEVALRDGRYDMVVHMVSAAIGAAPFYTRANNAARRESPAEAAARDRRTRAAWVGHPHLRIVDNRSTFRAKIDRVYALVADCAGIPGAVGWPVRKFRVARVGPSAGDVCAEFDVQQTFLLREPGVVESVRVRSDGRGRTFVHKVRREGGPETKRAIRHREYLTLLAHADVKRRTVRIRRRCCEHGDNYFVIDEFVNVVPQVVLVRCHFESGEGDIQFPDWLSVEREVTGELEYTVYAMSRNVVADRVRTGADGKTIERWIPKQAYSAPGEPVAKSL